MVHFPRKPMGHQLSPSQRGRCSIHEALGAACLRARDYGAAWVPLSIRSLLLEEMKILTNRNRFHTDFAVCFKK